LNPEVEAEGGKVDEVGEEEEVREFKMDVGSEGRLKMSDIQEEAEPVGPESETLWKIILKRGKVERRKRVSERTSFLEGKVSSSPPSSPSLPQL